MDTDNMEAMMGSYMVTGASTGIGRATVGRLVAGGHRVWATVRRDEDAGALRTAYADRVVPVLLDVTDEEGVTAVGRQVVAAGPLDGLVNNAGIAVPAPLEYLSPADLRRQLEVNLVGQLAVTQSVLPALRAATGRIVMVGSIGDRIAGPLLGAYHASKFGLLGLTDSLRAELAPWRLRVITVEPGAIATPMWQRGTDTGLALRAGLSTEGEQRYGAALQAKVAEAERSQRTGAEPAAVADVIVTALTARNPRHRYLVGRDARIASVVATLPHRLRYRLTAAS